MGNSEDNKPRSRRPFAKKSLGQNFLVSQGYVSKIVAALSLKEGDRVVEIGPGRGALTRELIETGASVTAVEIDEHLAELLEQEFGRTKNFKLVTGDFLESDLEDIVPQPPAKVAANLPYYISTPILRKLFSSREMFSELVVMLQREVADRITAQPGDSDRGFLTVLIERGFSSERLFDVPAGAFRPVPKVESAVVRLTSRRCDEPAGADPAFEELASAAFRQKRKTLKNNLEAAGGRLGQRIEALGGAETVMKAAGLDSMVRAEALSKDEWRSLFEVVFGGTV